MVSCIFDSLRAVERIAVVAFQMSAGGQKPAKQAKSFHGNQKSVSFQYFPVKSKICYTLRSKLTRTNHRALLEAHQTSQEDAQ